MSAKPIAKIVQTPGGFYAYNATVGRIHLLLPWMLPGSIGYAEHLASTINDAHDKAIMAEREANDRRRELCTQWPDGWGDRQCGEPLSVPIAEDSYLSIDSEPQPRLRDAAKCELCAEHDARRAAELLP